MAGRQNAYGETETARAIFALSRDATREFPMAPLGINVTKAALKALRLGHLNETANACGSVWDALDRFYKGAWIEFFAVSYTHLTLPTILLV